MTLPDVERLKSVPNAVWKSLGDRLRAIAFDGRFVASAMRAGERLDDAMRAPMRLWRLRKRHEPAAYAMRALMFGDPVSERDLTWALTDLAPLRDGGLLVESGGGWISPYRLTIAFDRYFISDDLSQGRDAVMGPGATTSYLCQASRRGGSMKILDLGCGAGTAAIVLADSASQLVATDINPRALALTSVNAALNDVRWIDLRHGDLFDPISDSDEHFDLIVSQPPFVASAPDAEASIFAAGGHRGDELAIRLLAEVHDHLTPHGRAILLVDWPVVEGDPIETRIRSVLPGNTNLLILQSPGRNLDEYVAHHAAAIHRSLDEAFSNHAIALREHLEELEIQTLKLTVTVVEPTTEAAGWTSVLPTRHFVDAPPNSFAIDHAIAARNLLRRGEEALLDAHLQIAPGLTMEEQMVAAGDPPMTIVRFPEARLVTPVVLQAAAAASIRAVAKAGSLRKAAALGKSESRVNDIREALLSGVLDVVEDV